MDERVIALEIEDRYLQDLEVNQEIALRGLSSQVSTTGKVIFIPPYTLKGIGQFVIKVSVSNPENWISGELVTAEIGLKKNCFSFIPSTTSVLWAGKKAIVYKKDRGELIALEVVLDKN